MNKEEIEELEISEKDRKFHSDYINNIADKLKEVIRKINKEREEEEKDVKKFTADFETSTLKWNEKETWVWAWATCEIGTEELKMGNTIDTFIEFCKNQKNAIFYFHNLKFDSEFIIYYLLTHGFEHVEKREDIKDNTFTTLISDMGVFYSVTVYFEKKNKKVKKATFFDSLKIIPFSVEQIAYSFNLPINKLTLDYDNPRKIGHELTKEEIEYIKNDVMIVAKALKILFDENLDRMTEGSNALHDFKKDYPTIILDSSSSIYLHNFTCYIACHITC